MTIKVASCQLLNQSDLFIDTGSVLGFDSVQVAGDVSSLRPAGEDEKGAKRPVSC
jgi:hypothetical protein